LVRRQYGLFGRISRALRIFHCGDLRGLWEVLDIRRFGIAKKEKGRREEVPAFSFM
jgi:hypothetical protein